jgi:hypothetical protein
LNGAIGVKMTTYNLEKVENCTWLVSTEENSFKIKKTPETYLIDGNYFVSSEELLNILTEIKIGEELANL